MLNTIGFRECEKALMLGHMYPQQEALQVGLVDKIVPAEQMQETVEAEMKKWLSIPGN
jgi:enoyl-CoA hydratase/carnithine racemase